MANESNPNELTACQKSWLDHLKSWETTNDSMKTYAEAHGLGAQSFYQWKSWLTNNGHYQSASCRTRFKRLKIKKQELFESSNGADYQLHLPNGASLEWSGSMNKDDLVELLKVAGTLP